MQRRYAGRRSLSLRLKVLAKGPVSDFRWCTVLPSNPTGDSWPMQLRLVDEDRVGISTSEATTRSTLVSVLRAFGLGTGDSGVDVNALDQAAGDALPDRSSGFA